LTYSLEKMEEYALFGVLALVAEIIGTISGFGSSILFVPIAALFFDFKTVLGITAVFHVFSNLSKIALFRDGVDKNISAKLGIPAIIFVIVGALLTNFLPTKPLELLMSLILVSLSIYLITHIDKKLEPSDRNMYIGGILSGLFAGLVGTGGAIRGITLSAFALPKQIFIATSALIDLGVDTSRAVVYVASGYFDQKYLVLIPLLIGISILGSYTGKLILNYASEKTFRYMVLAIVFLTSMYQFYTVIWKS